MSRWRGEIFQGELAEALDGSTLVIAGCGADGSHAAQALAAVLMHAPNGVRMIFADPDTYSPENLGIQVVKQGDLGFNKALVTARNIEETSHGAIETVVVEEGITLTNIAEILDGATYVVDATDISVVDVASKLHENAAQSGIPVVVPWSLGLGSAVVACTERGQFDEWTKQSLEIGAHFGLEFIGDLARWLVHIPEGLSLGYINQLLKGEVPTPTTYSGAVSGGHQASRWICEHAMGMGPENFDTVYVHEVRGMESRTDRRNIADALRSAMRQLVEI